jgi:hypothetical protein
MSPEERVHIGGDLYMTSLTVNGIGIEHLHRFEEWPHDWNAMCAEASDETTLGDAG